MSQLRYLIEEICAGVEVYFTGRSGGQYLKTSFILCDDYTELTSKLFLLTDNRNWSDQKPQANPGARPKFKNYHEILTDVHDVFQAKRAADLPKVDTIHTGMKARRTRRNDFFHSTHLLDLNVSQARCVEVFCDLLDYGQLLFGNDWTQTTAGARNLETLEVLLRLELRSYADPSIPPKVNKVLADWPRNISNAQRSGVHLAVYPEDLHLRLCVTCGGKTLRDRLKAI